MKKRKWKVRTILVTAGPTVEDIDPVRFISNRSSGKLGVEVAAAGVRAGLRVILIHGPVAENVLKRIRQLGRAVSAVAVRSAADMHRAVKSNLARADAVIMTAAVADFTPAVVSATKLKKAQPPPKARSKVRAETVLKLKPTVDILAEVGGKKGTRARPLLIGFALETGTGRTDSERRIAQTSEAIRKLCDKNLDAIVLDSPSAMAADSGDFKILFRDGTRRDCSGMSKRALARVLIKFATTPAPPVIQ